MTTINGVSTDAGSLDGYAAYADISAGKKIRLIAGTIRSVAGVWEWLDDANHNPIPNGVGISQDGSAITITYGFDAAKVLSLIVTPDEAMAKFYSCGVSVGKSNSVIVIYHQRPFGGKVHYTGLAWANVGGYSADSISYNAGTGLLTIDHSGYLASGVADIQLTSHDPAYVPVVASFTSTTIVVAFYDWTGAQYIGAANADMSLSWSRTQVLTADPGDTYPANSNLFIFGVMEMT